MKKKLMTPQNMRLTRWIIAIMKHNVKNKPLSSYISFIEAMEEMSCLKV